MQQGSDRYGSLEVQADERQKIARRIFRQVEAWGLKIPDVPFYMFHFGLDDFSSVGETEFWIANEPAAGYCAKLIYVFDDQECPYHHHRVKHETFYVVKGSARMVVDGKKMTMTTGDILPVPPGTRHRFAGEKGPCLLLEVSMPSVPGDSFFEDARIGFAGTI